MLLSTRKLVVEHASIRDGQRRRFMADSRADSGDDSDGIFSRENRLDSESQLNRRIASGAASTT